MNVLILVLSARREPWNHLMDCQMETWDSEDHPHTHTIYYCGKSQDGVNSTRLFYSPNLTESLEDVSLRTLEAFEMALSISSWDYLARPHSSTYVHKRNLVKFCETLHIENVICGIMTSGEKPFIWGGGHYIFSRDVIERMVANKDKWNRNVMDDQSITLMAEELGILVTQGHTTTVNLQPDGSFLTLVYGHGDNFTFTDFEDFNKAEGHFFVRCKHDPDRTQDLRIMRELHKHWK
jgi:hypothetical protein